MVVFFGFLVLGGVLLYFGAEWLVRGASRLALSLGVAPLVIGLTVVSYGTSAPELVVSLMASIHGKSELAVGNVVGSNIANLGLILGVTALVAPPVTDGCMKWRELPVLLVATLMLPLLLLDGSLSRGEGLLLLSGALAFSVATLYWSRGRHRLPNPLAPINAQPSANKLLLLGLVLLGLSGLIAGGHVFVRGAVGLARECGLSERVIGLTIVAVGTSLPELAASLVAALRGESEIAIGNVVGSNIFNLLLVLGAAGSVHPIHIRVETMLLDLGVLLCLTVVGVWSLRRQRRLTRTEGVLYAGAYIGFLVALLLT